jgi:hypothetical protein
MAREIKTGWIASAGEAIKKMSPYVVSFAIVLWWQHVGAKILLGWHNPKDIEFTFSHLFKAFGAGFECVTNRVIHACVLAVRPALTQFGPALWSIWILAVGTVGVAAYHWDGFPGSKKVEGKKTAIFVLAAFIGAYAPYALSGSYMPAMFGIMSRTNGTGAWVGGLLIAWLFDVIRQRSDRGGFGRWQAALVAVFFGFFTLANWHATWEYAQSWDIQTSVLRKVTPHLKKMDRTATVLLDGVPRHYGKAIVFDATYDFDYALKVYAGRTDVYGKLLSPGVVYGKKEVVIRDYGSVMRFPYQDLYRYDYTTDVFERLEPGSS